jgi:ATP-dependent RNA helicase SUPV3L1/SUV3
VIFYTTYKFYNRKEHPLTISEIRQIGGRAGRYGKEKTGYVAAFNNKDLDNIKSAFKSKIPEVEKAFIIPTIEHIEIISQITNTKNISDIFKYFRKYVQINSDLFQLSDLSELIYKSKQLNHITDLKTAFTFAVAPVDVKSELVFNYYKDYIDNVTQNKTVNPPMLSDLRNQNFNEINNMRNLESFIKVCNLYNWLHFRYPEHFFDIETCSIEKNKAISKVITILNSENLIKKCRFCGRHLPLDFKFNICNICHHKTYRKSKKRYFKKKSYKRNK